MNLKLVLCWKKRWFHLKFWALDLLFLALMISKLGTLGKPPVYIRKTFCTKVIRKHQKVMQEFSTCHHALLLYLFWIIFRWPVLTAHCEFPEYILKYQKKCLEDLTTFFISTWWVDSKKMEEIEFSWWLFEGRLRQGKNVLPDGLNWLCYFAGSSKSHRENSISFVVKSSKHFFGVFQYSRNSQ